VRRVKTGAGGRQGRGYIPGCKCWYAVYGDFCIITIAPSCQNPAPREEDWMEEQKNQSTRTGLVFVDPMLYKANSTPLAKNNQRGV